METENKVLCNLYFPLFTIEKKGSSAPSRRVFNPTENYQFTALTSAKKGAFFPLFTDDDFAQRAAEYFWKKNGTGYSVVELQHPQHAQSILDKFKSGGVLYVGRDCIFTDPGNVAGVFTPIEQAIDAVRNYKFIQYKDNDLGNSG